MYITMLEFAPKDAGDKFYLCLCEIDKSSPDESRGSILRGPDFSLLSFVMEVNSRIARRDRYSPKGAEIYDRNGRDLKGNLIFLYKIRR